MELKSNTENSNKKSNRKIILIMVFFLFIIIIFLAMTTNKENKEREFIKKLSDSWSNESGVTITFYQDNTCRVYFDLGEYSSAAETSNCKYKVLDDKITASFDVKITYPESQEATFEWEFEYDKELNKLTRIDKDAGSEEETKEFKRGTFFSKEEQVEEPKNETKPYYREYNLTGTTDGRVAKITFEKEGKCEIDLSSLRRTVNLGPYPQSDYMYINYYDGECTYEETSDKELTIHYMGAFDVMHEGRYVNYKSYIVQNDNQEIKIHFSDDYSTFEKTNGSFKMANYAIYFDGATEGAKIQYGKPYTTHNLTIDNNGGQEIVLREDGTGTFEYMSLGNGRMKIDVTYTVNGNHLEITGTEEGNSLICTIEDDNSIECSLKDRGLTSHYLVEHNTEECKWDLPKE